MLTSNANLAPADETAIGMALIYYLQNNSRTIVLGNAIVPVKVSQGGLVRLVYQDANGNIVQGEETINLIAVNVMMYK